MESYLTKTEIRYSQVDSGLHVTLLALAQIIEDATTKYLDIHHLSGGYLNKKYGAIVVVLRNHLIFHERCHFKDVLLSKVHLVRKSSVAFTLKTLIYRQGEEEKPLITSYIQISAIDMNTRELRSLTSFSEFNELNVDDFMNTHVLFSKYSDEEDETTFYRTTRVESSDIDYSNHLNNIAYIKYFMNCLSASELRHLRFKEMEINYIQEAREGQEMLISCTKKDSALYFSAKIDSNTVTKAKITL